MDYYLRSTLQINYGWFRVCLYGRNFGGKESWRLYSKIYLKKRRPRELKPSFSILIKATKTQSKDIKNWDLAHLGKTFILLNLLMDLKKSFKRLIDLILQEFKSKKDVSSNLPIILTLYSENHNLIFVVLFVWKMV